MQRSLSSLFLFSTNILVVFLSNTLDAYCCIPPLFWCISNRLRRNDGHLYHHYFGVIQTLSLSLRSYLLHHYIGVCYLCSTYIHHHYFGVYLSLFPYFSHQYLGGIRIRLHGFQAFPALLGIHLFLFLSPFSVFSYFFLIPSGAEQIKRMDRNALFKGFSAI